MVRKLLLLFCLVLPLRASAELLRDSAVYDGVTREWFVHVPSGYDGSRPLPLVIALHGSGSSGDRFSALTGWTDVADDGQFLAVFPTAAPPQNIWNIYFLIQKPDDVSWLLQLISILRSKYSIDSTRIYMTGFSNGAAMTNTFAGVHSDALAAIAPVSGSWITAHYSPAFDAESLLQPKGPLPVWIWRGQLETHRDGLGLQGRELQDLMQKLYWMAVNQVVRAAVIEREPPFTTEIYEGPAEVRFTEIANLGHAYDPRSSAMIWSKFFSQKQRGTSRRRGVRRN